MHTSPINAYTICSVYIYYIPVYIFLLKTEIKEEFMNNFHFDTRAIHAGQQADPSTGAVMTPIYATSTYKQQSPGVHQGYEYSRTQNPTRHAYESCLAN